MTEGERLIWAAAYADFLGRLYERPPNRGSEFHPADFINAVHYANDVVRMSHVAVETERTRYPTSHEAADSLYAMLTR